MAIASAKAELQALMAEHGALLADNEEESGADGEEEKEGPEEGSPEAELLAKKKELMEIVATGGRDPTKPAWTGPKVRVYFPDEGSAALARRDWGLNDPNPEKNLVPPCVEFSSCGGVQMQDISDDMLIFFFVPVPRRPRALRKFYTNTKRRVPTSCCFRSLSIPYLLIWA